MILLDGRKVAAHFYEKLQLEISLLPVVPRIKFILVGDDGASLTYVGAKAKKSTELGIRSETIRLPQETSESELIALVQTLNHDKDTHGILVQLPLPKQISKQKVMESISPLKDVDGLSPLNSGRLFQGIPGLVPCTPKGIIEMLNFYQLPLSGKKACVLGRSEIVGKPLALLLLQQNMTVTVCHSKSRNLIEETRSADYLFAAVGQPKMVTAEMVKEGAVVVDIGIHRTPQGLTGDVDFENVKSKCLAITPVPGGVGPLTICMLMKNLIEAAKALSI